MTTVGTNTAQTPRIDAAPKVTGQAIYTADLPLPPGTLYGAILRSPYAHARLVCIDAQQAERLPGVHAVVTREHLFRSDCRHAVVYHVKTAVKADGTLMAQDIDRLFDKGAYAHGNGMNVPRRGSSLAWGPYRVPHLRVVGRSYFTNKVPAGAFRSLGRAQTTWGYESHYDMIARQLGIEPVAFRRHNFLQRGERLIETVGPFDADDGQLLNGDSFQYHLPLLHDLPQRLTSIMVENHDGPGPLGAKGMSQTAVSPIAPAIANAIYDAVGVRIKALPITPEKILRGLHRPGRWRAHQLLHVPGLRGLRKVCHDDRGAGARRPPGPTPEGLQPTRCGPSVASVPRACCWPARRSCRRIPNQPGSRLAAI
jgi:CO/xanthine dehydrogenase Mo-binding subunit